MKKVNQKSSIHRRSLLQGGSLLSSSLFLPWISRAHAQDNQLPKRLIVVHHPQGHSLQHCIPTSTGSGFAMPFALQPLEQFRNKMVLLSGIDNQVAPLNSVSTAHPNAAYTFLTCQKFLVQDPNFLTAGGPSIEEIIAQRISQETPYPRLDFAIGGTRSDNGIYLPHDEHHFWLDANDPVGAFNDPFVAVDRIFASQNIDPIEQWQTQSRRAAVLQRVQQNFSLMEEQLSGEEKERLQAHQNKIESLFRRNTLPVGSCNQPLLSLPYDYDYTYDDHLSAPIMQDILIAALACDMTRVGTISFANAQDHGFEWLWSENGDQPIVDRSRFDNWHAMVHADYQSGMEYVYRWYSKMLARFLQKLSETTDSDGDNMLDSSLVISISEFSSPRHWHKNIPILLFGNTGFLPQGHHISYMPYTLEDFVNSSGMLESGFSMNQFCTTLLHLFGFDDEHFGIDDASISSGTLPL